MIKKLILCLIFILVLYSLANASPFLTCDAYPTSDGITKFYLVFDGTNPILVPIAQSSSGITFMYDLAPIPIGTHTVTATACRESADWGEECSDSSVPFTFVRPAKSRKPVIKLSK